MSLNSTTNGTFVNGTTVATRLRKDKDRIKVGRGIFKFPNNDNGPPAGDRVLARLAALISSGILHGDIFRCYDRGEFALLMPEMRVKGVNDVAERLRKLVAEAHFEFDGIDLMITISAGVAIADMSMKTLMTSFGWLTKISIAPKGTGARQT